MTEDDGVAGKDPLVTIAICTFNRASVLPRAVESVLAQTYTELELIVVDDCSTDDTLDVLKQFTDPRLTVVSNAENRGIGASRNVALEHATGSYLGFLDDDDEFHPTKTEQQVRSLEAAPATVGASWCFQEWRTGSTTSERRIVLRGDVFEQVRAADVVMLQPLLVRRSVFDVTGPFDPELESLEDFDWSFRLAKHFQFDTVEEVLVVMHHTPSSLSKDDTKRIRALQHLLDKYPELGGHGPTRSRWLIRLAESRAANGDRSGWRAGMVDAWRAHPTGLRVPVLLIVGTVFGPDAPTEVKRRLNRLRRRARQRSSRA